MSLLMSETEKAFMIDGLRQGIRTDGRSLMDSRPFQIHLGTVPETFGSCTLVYGQEDVQIVCAIKSEVIKPIPSEPDKGQINFYLESSQTGRTLFTREDAAEHTKNRMLLLVQQLYSNIIDRSELIIFKNQHCWNLNVDILVFSELSLSQIDYICMAIRGSFQDLKLPQTIATLNNNTGLIEIGLVEEIHTDKENTDKPVILASATSAPFVISIGIIADDSDTQSLPILPLLDASIEEMCCLDQTLHITVSCNQTSEQSKDKKLAIHSVVQSKGETSYATATSCIAGIPAALFLAKNFSAVIEGRMSELQRSVTTEDEEDDIENGM